MTRHTSRQRPFRDHLELLSLSVERSGLAVSPLDLGVGFLEDEGDGRDQGFIPSKSRSNFFPLLPSPGHPRLLLQ